MLPRSLSMALVLAVVACAPDIPQQPPPSDINYAVFDLTKGQIPQPNDLSLQPTVIAGLPNNAQKELLQTFAAAGGYPNDQETPVTIELQRVNYDPKTKTTSLGAPTLDISSIHVGMNLIGLEVMGTAFSGLVNFDPVTAADYTIDGDHGTLTLHNQGRKPWPAGMHIIVALKGGPGGVTVQNGQQLQAAPTFYLLTQNQNLSQPPATALLPGPPTQQAQEGQQLELIRQQYQPVFSALELVGFPRSSLASLATFQIAPAVTHVETSAAEGAVPIPSDLLLDSSGKHVQLIPAFGPLAPGIATLDGFSTTAPILAQTSAPVLANTITKDTVFLYDLTDPAHPVLVPDATQMGGVYETEPAQVTQMNMMGMTVSSAIVLQPAIPFVGAAGAGALPPLKEDTEYAVVISNGVKDTMQNALSRSTLSSVLLFQDPLVDASGNSELPGVDNATAAGLERMRQALIPVLAQVQKDKGISASNVATAYTFRTQTITGKNAVGNPNNTPGLLQLAALPYADAQQSTMFVPSMPDVLMPTEAFARYGIDGTIVPFADIAEVLQTTIPTINLLSDASGAFDLAHPKTETIDVLIAVPAPAAVPACPSGAGFPMGAHCAPLVIFHHGLDRARGDLLAVANELTKQGFVAAAIDAPKHGDRSWCSSDMDCATGGTCVPIPGAAAQGDAVPPGTCSNSLKKAPILCATPACLAAWAATGNNQNGLALASSQYLVSANFFRARDTFRQDVIDNSALILALARPPPPALPAPPHSNPVTDHLAMSGIVIDPSQVYWEGQSLGSILGTLNVATDPRISRATFTVGGGTIVDILTNAPAFSMQVNTLLTGLGIQPGTPQYLQFILLAKWILDPAEPVNFARNLLGDANHPTLPNLLQMMPSQAGKKVLGQLAACDMTVPNAFNLELYGLIGLGPASATESTITLFENTANAGGMCPFGVAMSSPGTVPHGFLVDWGVSLDALGMPMIDANVQALTKIAQDQNAAFLADPTKLPPPIQTQP